MKLAFFDIFSTCCWWWLLFWMFLSFLLGWLLRKLCGSNDDCCDELDRCRSRYDDLEDKYNLLLKSSESVQTVPAAGLASDFRAKYYNMLSPENLQIIEGIGPKMEKVLKDNNINTWSNLADNTASNLRALLDKQDANYKIIDPTTWSDQAQLAVDGKWEELIQMQKNLDTGKTDTLGDTDSKLEKIMIKLGLLKQWKLDDLKAIEGIGPKIEDLLHNAGIKTWRALSDTSVNKIQEILDAAGDRFNLANPGTWPQQAKLAAEGKFDELQALQDELLGGM